MLTDVETFDLFFFGDADATEKSADHRPGDEAGNESPDGVSSTANGLDTQLGDAAAIEQADASRTVNAPEANNQGSPNAANTVNGERTDRIINAR